MQPLGQYKNSSFLGTKQAYTISRAMAAFSLSSCSIIFTIVGALLPSIVHSSTLESDIYTLQLLKGSIDPSSIPPSSYLSSWDFNLDPCEPTGGRFPGILCTVDYDNSTTRITAIDLDGVGYDGFLTSSVGNLTELRSLDLSGNRIRGPIPDSISNLKKLVRISLSHNYFTGSIPAGMADFKELETIDLSKNRLSGAIPAKLSRLRSLIHIRLSGNELVGGIPDLTGSWRLETLELDFNLLYGNLPKFPISLTILNLAHNLLTGQIAQVEGLQKLTSLDLSDNRLSGSVTTGVLTLPQVKYINVSFNQFTSLEVVQYTGIESRLQVLDAQENRLHGHLPVMLVTAEHLTVVNLARNRFSGSIPREYGEKLGRWKGLFLDHNYLSGNVPREFNSSFVGIVGSLEANCLSCPVKNPTCRGRQRPASDCVRHNDDSE